MIIIFDYNHHFLLDTKRKGKIIDSMNLIQRLMSTWWTNHLSQIHKIIFLVYFDGLLRYLIHRFRSKLKKSKSKIPPQITVNNDLMTQKRICLVYHTIHIGTEIDRNGYGGWIWVTGRWNMIDMYYFDMFKWSFVYWLPVWTLYAPEPYIDPDCIIFIIKVNFWMILQMIS